MRRTKEETMDTMQTPMMPVPLSLNRLLEHAGRLFPEREIVTRLPDKSLRRRCPILPTR